MRAKREAQASRLRLSAITALALVPLPVLSSPFEVRDENPLLSGFGIPPALPARFATQSAWTWSAQFSLANSSLVQTNARESLVVDAETRELRLTVGRDFGTGYRLQAQLPYRRTSAGSLDGFIDSWHDAFGLPEGDRPTMPRDKLLVRYERAGKVVLEQRAPSEAVGDIALQLGKQLVRDENTAVTAWIALELPTGDTAALTGNDSIDISLAVAAEHRLGERWHAFGQFALAALGEDDRFAANQREWAWSAMAGLSMRTWGTLTLTAQIDAHSAVVDSELDFLGAAALLSVGGSFAVSNDWHVSLGVSEDIAVETTPDVVFLAGLKKTF